MSEIGSRRYPDPAVRVLDPRFGALRLPSASVECLFQGARWSEGPVWFGDGRYLLWSDIPNNRMLRWDEQSGTVGVFRQPSNNANGNTRDRAGRLVTCEHLTRRVTRTEYDGSITVLAERFAGKRFNSPNDVIVKSDGSIWFSDPDFGIQSFYEGEKQASEVPERVYRIDPQTGAVDIVVDGVLGRMASRFRRTKRCSMSSNRKDGRARFARTTSRPTAGRYATSAY